MQVHSVDEVFAIIDTFLTEQPEVSLVVRATDLTNFR